METTLAILIVLIFIVMFYLTWLDWHLQREKNAEKKKILEKRMGIGSFLLNFVISPAVGISLFYGVWVETQIQQELITSGKFAEATVLDCIQGIHNMGFIKYQYEVILPSEKVTEQANTKIYTTTERFPFAKCRRGIQIGVRFLPQYPTVVRMVFGGHEVYARISGVIIVFVYIFYQVWRKWRTSKYKKAP